MAAFKFDENLPAEAAAIFSNAGYDAVSVLDQNLGGEPDSSIAAICNEEGRALVSLDIDFADIRNYPPAEHSGIIVLRLARLDKLHVISVLRRLVTMIQNEPI
jgi:predicted nuclease of predicted toxin-antitoxin system